MNISRATAFWFVAFLFSRLTVKQSVCSESCAEWKPDALARKSPEVLTNVLGYQTGLRPAQPIQLTPHFEKTQVLEAGR